ncbi:hypothetical protein CDD81_536 [Ophiocordyceps australis]|uniref:Uncharacterized protein n=1 Tax=Ophiocordyceps australis TaxID=1399860 RepID=A0A2C5YGJ1_9HYPO|nr:hypothetical protein CDD81_536 [Ophiocordyceps australis]
MPVDLIHLYPPVAPRFLDPLWAPGSWLPNQSNMSAALRLSRRAMGAWSLRSPAWPTACATSTYSLVRFESSSSNARSNLAAIIRNARVSPSASRPSSAANGAGTFDSLYNNATAQGAASKADHDVPRQSLTSDVVPPPPPASRDTLSTQSSYKNDIPRSYSYDANSSASSLERLHSFVQPLLTRRKEKALRESMDEARITTRPATGFTIFIKQKSGPNTSQPKVSRAAGFEKEEIT